MSAPKLLDLFCCDGGCSMGYSDAGFDVTGVDIVPRLSYPFPFIEADALDVLADTAFLNTFDVIHASPPCQRYSVAAAAWGNADTHPDLVPPVAEALGRLRRQLFRSMGELMGVPWIASRDAVSESIPPAYTNYLGAQVRDHLARAAA